MEGWCEHAGSALKLGLIPMHRVGESQGRLQWRAREAPCSCGVAPSSWKTDTDLFVVQETVGVSSSWRPPHCDSTTPVPGCKARHHRSLQMI